MLAWWEYLQSSGAKFATIGMLGPLKDKNFAVVSCDLLHSHC